MTDQSSANYQLFYDGACPLCQKEVRWLKTRVAGRKIRFDFVDISQPDFDPAKEGKTLEAFMGLLHLKGPQGQWWTAMEATRMIYKAIGLGWVMAPTGWPLLRPVFDKAYLLFARYRPRLQSERNDIQCTDRCRPRSEK